MSRKTLVTSLLFGALALAAVPVARGDDYSSRDRKIAHHRVIAAEAQLTRAQQDLREAQRKAAQEGKEAPPALDHAVRDAEWLLGYRRWERERAGRFIYTKTGGGEPPAGGGAAPDAPKAPELSGPGGSSPRNERHVLPPRHRLPYAPGVRGPGAPPIFRLGARMNFR